MNILRRCSGLLKKSSSIEMIRDTWPLHLIQLMQCSGQSVNVPCIDPDVCGAAAGWLHRRKWFWDPKVGTNHGYDPYEYEK